MTSPAWCRAVLRLVAAKNQVDEVLGDLEETHRRRRRDRNGFVAGLLTTAETTDVAFALLRERFRPGVSTLDFKLGLRMLIRHPGLTALGGVALAFAILVGAGTFEFVRQVMAPRLPLPEGDRIVGVRLRSTETSRTVRGMAWDFTRWSVEARTLEPLAAWTNRRRNLIVGEGPGTPVQLAEISASGFRVAGVPPHLGRWLQEADQQPGAEPVVVLGYDLWRDRLAADPGAVGSALRLGDQVTTVVGVMPEGFRFPVSHDGWIPLPASLAGYGPLEGPELDVFGRLVEGASRWDADTELSALAARVAVEHPRTHARLQAEVVPFHRLILYVPPSARALVAAAFVGSNVPIVLFLLIIGGNVALLTFARVTAREDELVVRSALGASRRRIVGQIFVEGLLLASLAAAVALCLVGFGLRWGYRIVEAELLGGQRLPFWFHPSLSPSTILYAGFLTALAAALVGVVPALKATKGLRSRLQRASAGGGRSVGFGGVWTVAIVSQIAVTCIAPVFTIAVWSESRQEHERVGLDIPAEDYIGARLDLDQEGVPDPERELAQTRFQTRYRETLVEMARRLAADPRVAGVAFSQRLPRQYHPWNQVGVDGPSAEPRDERGHRLGQAIVDPDFFRSLDIEILQGRNFDAGDLEEGERNVIVNESFVRRILGGRNPIGRRFRYLANEANRDPDQEPGPWHEIVGVVGDLGVASGYGAQGVYHPAAPSDILPVYVIAHVPGGAEGLGSAIASTAFDVAPTLRVSDVTTLARITDSTEAFYRFWFTLLIVVTGIALLLSLGGMYAIMSFTVTRRTREIGIRVALGSSRGRVVASILRQPVRQLLTGVVTGVAVLVALIYALGDNLSHADLWLALAYAIVMMAVCMTACVVPAHHVLRLEVRDALGGEG